MYTSSALVLPGKTQAKWSNKEYAPMVVTECSERAIFGTCCGVVQKKKSLELPESEVNTLIGACSFITKHSTGKP